MAGHGSEDKFGLGGCVRWRAACLGPFRAGGGVNATLVGGRAGRPDIISTSTMAHGGRTHVCGYAAY